MKRLFIAFAIAFSHTLIDLNLLNRRSKSTTFVITSERDLEDTKQKKHRNRRQYKSGKYTKLKMYAKRHFKFNDSRPKDHRYSDQKKLRRMYRNA